MKERPYTGFYARFLGSYSLNYFSREIRLDINIKSKSMQIFLLLLKAGDEGIARDELIKMLQIGEDVPERCLNNLRQQIYLLRRAVARSDFPPGRYIVLEKSRYYFSPEYHVETDTGYLDRLLLPIRNGPEERDPSEEGLAEGKQDAYQSLLMDFCQHYTGEFLPMLSGEEWATVEAAYYQKWYFHCLNRLCGMLKEQGKYETMLELCSAASQMHPYDEWQAMQIDCLMFLHRYKEAQKVYEDATRLFYEELGVSSMDQVMAKYRNDGGQMLYAANALAGVKEGLREPGEIQGAYECSYPSFLDIYHIISRNEERLEMSSTLMVAALGEDGAYLQSSGKEENRENAGSVSGPPDFERKMEMLRQVIREGVRSGDVYTRYSRNQYLVLLNGAKETDGQKVARRLENRWKEISGDGKTEASFEVYTVEGSGTEGCMDAEERDICSACDQPGKRHMAGAGNLAG